MKSKAMWRTAVALVATGVVCAGCANYLEPRSRVTERERREAEWANLRAQTVRMEQRLESVEAVQQRSQDNALARLTEAERTSAALERRLLALEQRMTALENTLAESERARAEDKRAVLEAIKKATAVRTPAVARGREHTVQQGETLSEIAKAYNVTVPAIVQANNLKDAHTIRIGQKLFIPD